MPPRALHFGRNSALLGALALAGISLLAWWFWRTPTPLSTSPGSTATESAQDDPTPHYAGSASCKGCHAEAYTTWADSHHGLAERPPSVALDRQAFDPPRSLGGGADRTEIASTGDHFALRNPGLSTLQATSTVARVIGHAPLRQFLVGLPGGRLQTHEASYDPARNEWFDVFGEEERKPGEWGHWTGRGMNWNSMCSHCHNTAVRKRYDPARDTYATTMTEATVSCESCHGPLQRHVAWQAEARAQGRPSQPDPTVAKLQRDQVFDTCATCHARRTQLTERFLPGDSFFDHFSLTLPDMSDLYFADGQVRDENYEAGAFLGSRMHAAGVRCADCHHPHSSKPLLPGNALCMRCHNGSFPNSPRIDPAAHTFHQPASTGSACVNCHMPQTTYMQRHPRHDHGFTVPDPQLTVEWGIPNACNRCHKDRTPQWALDATRRWYGSRLELPNRVQARNRARAIASARANRPQARQALVEQLALPQSPYWTAALTGLLEPWTTHPEVRTVVLRQLEHSHPAVREAAARALAPIHDDSRAGIRPALEARLQDAHRNVRLAAAWTLRGSLGAQAPVFREMQATLEFHSDQPTGQLQWGALRMARGEIDLAIQHYTRAATWDPLSAPIRHDLAVALGAANRPGEAVRELEAACALDPRDGDLRYKLALAQNEAGQSDAARLQLEQATQLDPQHARAWYNLGLARHGAQDTEGALAALLQAETLTPQDAGPPYARATILAQLGRIDEALAAGRRALEIDPGFQDARTLVEQLGRSRR